jgi:hypothetical protein
MDEPAIKQIISDAQKVLDSIGDDHIGSDVRHEKVRNMLSMAEMELKFHELNKMDVASLKLVEIVRTLGSNVEALQEATKKSEQTSIKQREQTNALIFWTGVMAFAVFAQVVVGAVQASIYYKQLKLSRAIATQSK